MDTLSVTNAVTAAGADMTTVISAVVVVLCGIFAFRLVKRVI